MLGVYLIHTGIGKTQAKGKIKKSFDYLQRHIPYLCERRGIKDIKGGNELLKGVLDYYTTRRVHEETNGIPEERWKNAADTGNIYFREIPPDMYIDFVFSLHYERSVRKDGMIIYRDKPWKIGKATSG
ncbi:hypothetical protein KAX35_00065 [candidate division WOR-3 bacterium]|nr:hypothetical protein [candidate division WOR-3 bacterium]